MILETNEREFNGNVLRIDRYDGYDFIAAAGVVHYTLLSYQVVMGYDEVSGEPILDSEGNHAYTIFKTALQSDSIELPMDVANQWGDDDDVIFNWLKNELTGN